MAKVFDVSEYQPDDRVQYLIENESPDGFIIRLGETLEGEPVLDEKFVQFVNEVVEAGIPYGIYYASHARNEDMFKMEANYINNQMFELLNGKLPELGVWWDVEVPVLMREDMWPQLRDTIGTMENWYGTMKIGVYSGYSFFNQWMDFGELAYYGIPVWVAQYGYPENSLKAEHPELKHVAWQYADEYGNLSQDVNEWYGFED